MLVDVIARNWGWIALRGAVALLFGLLTFFNPAITLATLVLLFGAYALVDGTFMVASAIARRRGEPRWLSLMFGGVVGIAAGLVTLFMPGLTAMALLALIAAWAMLSGLTELVAAIRLRKELRHEWILAFAGTLSVAFGVFLVAFPRAGALAVALWIGAYAVVTGLLLLGLALQLRTWDREHGMGPTPRPV